MLTNDVKERLLAALKSGCSYRAAAKEAGVDKGTAMRYFKLYFGLTCKCGRPLEYAPRRISGHRQSCWYERQRRLEKGKMTICQAKQRFLRQAKWETFRLRYALRFPGAYRSLQRESERAVSSPVSCQLSSPTSSETK